MNPAVKFRIAVFSPGDRDNESCCEGTVLYIVDDNERKHFRRR